MAVAPDGTTLVAAAGRVVRLPPDGRVLSDLPLPRAGVFAGMPLNETVVRLPLPGRGTPCAGGRPWTIKVLARFTNRAGVPTASRLSYASRCPSLHRTAR